MSAALSFWRRGTAQHGKIINPASLHHFYSGFSPQDWQPRPTDSEPKRASWFLYFFRYCDTFIIPLSHIFISGYSILAISVLQSAQEIELHAQFAQHYLARHYSGLWRTWCWPSLTRINSVCEKELWREFLAWFTVGCKEYPRSGRLFINIPTLVTSPWHLAWILISREWFEYFWWTPLA